MLTVNPDEKELNHIQSSKEALKTYVQKLMDQYAENFHRMYADGKPMKGEDLVYFAKIETKRTYKFSDPTYKPIIQHNNEVSREVLSLKLALEKLKKGQATETVITQKSSEITAAEKKYIRNTQGTIILEGKEKDGNNMHVHIVVSRYDRKQKFKLSPLSNQRSGKGILNGKTHEKGFHRDEFVRSGEQLFDRQFNYQRHYKQSYDYRLGKDILLGVTNPKSLARVLAKRALLETIQNRQLQKAFGLATSNPKQLPQKAINQLEQEAIKSVLKTLNSGAANVAAVNVAKSVIINAAKAISKTVDL